MRNSKYRNRQLSTYILGFFLCLVVGQSVYADDIEIYEAIFNAEGNSDGSANNDPNVLFILDNSLSMDDYRLVQDGPIAPPGPYDPERNYGGGSEFNTNIYLYNTSMEYLGVSSTQNQNVCQAALDSFAANPNLPLHQDQVIQWTRFSNRGYGWTLNYINTNDNKRVFECEDDNGVHGRTSGGRGVYPRVCSAGTGTCSSNSGNALYRRNQQFVNGRPWPYNFFSNEIIMVAGNYHEYLNLGDSQTASASNCSFNDEILIDSATNTQFRCLQKLVIMKRALLNVVEGDPDDSEDNGFDNINLGLMRFNYNASAPGGGTIVDAIAPIDGRIDPDDASNTNTNRDDFIAKVNNIQFEGNTPLAESTWEAYRYFKGQSPFYGETSPRDSNQDSLDSDAVDSGNYKSPLTENQCQGSYSVLLSDGQPTSDTNRNNDIISLYNSVIDPDISGCGNTCLNEITAVLNQDLGVNTYTIGFDLGDAAGVSALQDAALAGSPLENAVLGDGYFQADDLQTLETVFSTILSDIQAIENDSFIAPAVTVNAFNRLQNRSDIYYAVFEPEINPRWNGNIKKYKIASNANIVDQKGLNAISDETGFFTDESQSYWSDDVDGPNVRDGGFAGELTVPRNLFASFDTATTAVTSFGVADVDTIVADFSKAVVELDATGAILGVLNTLTGTLTDILDILTGGTASTPLSENFEDIVRWTFGQDIERRQGGEETDPNKFIAESIHSTPYVLSYGTSDAAPRDVVFMTSNQGLLHAITGQGADESDGEAGEVGGSERWAYLPDPDLLKNFGGYYNRELDGSDDHVYGLDGEISFDVERAADQSVSKAHLFFGQRRGGNKYFAVDVTNGYSTTDPVKKLWTVEGGTGDLARLGQTWAKPVVSKLRTCTSSTCSLTDVLVIGGGYDTDYDDASRTVASISDDNSEQDTLGNAIYILDALTGDVLWAASNTSANVDTSRGDLVVPEMDHSFAAPATVLDINKDGAIDIIFAIDLAGQVFRFDFRQNAAQTTVIRSGGRIANLQESGVNRRFYNPVDAVLLPSTDDGARARIALVTGSGYRAHPLLEEGGANRFYVIYDENILAPNLDALGSAEYDYVVNETTGATTLITSSVLPEVTDSTVLAPGSTHQYGYYVTLADTIAEKVINPTLIADFQVIGVTYKPTNANSNLCSAAAGTSTAYQLDLLTGEVQFLELTKPGVSAAPVLVYILEVDATSGKESLKPIVIIGTEPFKGVEFDIKDITLGKAEKRGWWEVDRQAAN